MKNDEILEPGNLLNPLPEFGARISQLVAESFLAGGAKLNELRVGSRLAVTTENRTYIIEKRGLDDYYISGHPEFCPEPTKAFNIGSTWGGSMMKCRFVGRDMCLEFRTEEYERVSTSLIREVKEI
ncbi:MAG: hypothetical protein WD898_03930 [Candidatus Paceibacterota bacterium]